MTARRAIATGRRSAWIPLVLAVLAVAYFVVISAINVVAAGLGVSLGA